MRYLGIEPQKPKIGVFDFTGCEGCELQFANKEESLPHFLNAVEVVNFREVSSAHGDDYEIAFVEGCISRADEVQRLQAIRQRAKVLVALGSCACFGGVRQQKNAFNLEHANREVYGDQPKDTLPVRAVDEVVKVDLKVPGCPVSKDEVESLVRHVLWGVPFKFPTYPVCWECKQRFTVCVYQLGQMCLGPVTRGGCNAPCPTGGLGCWGCRGPAEAPNVDELKKIARQKGHSEREIAELLGFFGGFEVQR